MEEVADRLKINPLHMCYHAQFRHTSLKRVITDKGEPQNLGTLGNRPLGVRACLIPKKIPLYMLQ